VLRPYKPLLFVALERNQNMFLMSNAGNFGTFYLFLPTEQQLLVEYHVVVLVVQFHNNVIADMKYSYRSLLGFIDITVLRTSMRLSLARSSCIVTLNKLERASMKPSIYAK